MNIGWTILMAASVGVCIGSAFGLGKNTMRVWIINIFIESLESDASLRTPDGMRAYTTLWKKLRLLR